MLPILPSERWMRRWQVINYFSSDSLDLSFYHPLISPFQMVREMLLKETRDYKRRWMRRWPWWLWRCRQPPGHGEEERSWWGWERWRNVSDLAAGKWVHARHFDTFVCATENHIKLSVKITEDQQSWADWQAVWHRVGQTLVWRKDN